MTGNPAAYPVTVMFRQDLGINRLWGIPLIGFLVRVILAIPLFLVLAILGIAVYVAILLLWIPVLLTGHQAGLVYTILGGYLRFSIRLLAYIYLLEGRYPPFTFGEHPTPTCSSISKKGSRSTACGEFPSLATWSGTSCSSRT